MARMPLVVTSTGATRSRERNWETGKQAHTHSLSIPLPASELYKRDQADSKDSLRNRSRDQRTAKKRQRKVRVFAENFRQEEDQEKEREKMTQNRSGLQCDIERCVKVVVA